jgi:2-C-methyl-D-erythritol 4-phosphate cytidylyltransferase
MTCKKNAGILLSGGFGNRFDSNVLKQMYNLNDSPLFVYSLKILLKTLDVVVIVVNTICFADVKHVLESDNLLKTCEIYLTINDDGDRLESICAGLSFIKDRKMIVSNLIIHDSSRPFIKEDHILNLISKMNDEILYGQYYFNLVNGLLRKNEKGYYEEADRREFIEICTPICTNFDLFEFLFANYLKEERRICWEIIPLLDLLEIKYELLEGDYNHMRKITTIKDITG